ncbi:potassium voltage-gated channel subfamily C member 1-like isoform X1 [Alosa sapidissima]|uniref:potassium voltage-gated channel subfamily C member 1-like isoform X1 n=1 Tax=Alosa sapidissima TaxID=34773 RepID=UPI001C08BC14|nr:potassium voltage-gated channel subfamily C member 1-like isoform X1 [Alosa sapidissima]XP_041915080.1 potassium voltage-gated channel subfamily C member 1-like isoform X1 [Alosa sapidissima]XP_041915081.1 potassium voltage-gated channel subfamily C member 1-like isoform X1 [Alosa sapidissima]
MASATSPPTHLMQVGPAASEAERVVINVGGVQHETYKSTLMSIPGTRLANLASDTSADPQKHPTSEFFFDRDPGAFAPILNYYRTGKLHCPADVCGQSFEEELSFWGVSETDVEPCCWKNFRQHQDEEEALAQFEPDEGPPDYSTLVGGPGRMQTSRVWISKMWALFDDPHSSVPAMIIGILSLLFILVSTIAFSLGTHPEFPEVLGPMFLNVVHEYSEGEYEVSNYQTNSLMIVEIVCNIWFTVEFLIRVICCPNKLKFVLNFLNIIDFVAILPFFMEVSWRGRMSGTTLFFLGCLRAARCIRLVRIFKMARCVTAVRALGHALRASICDLCLLGIALSVALLVFSILMYCAEHITNDLTHFRTVPMALWWAVVTMTTVGYGDMYPESWPGMVIASLCAMTGVLFITMPIPILVNKFAKYYALTEARQRQRAKRRRGDGRSAGASAPVWRGVENLHSRVNQSEEDTKSSSAGAV